MTESTRGPTTPARAAPVRDWLALAETSLGNASDRLDAINIFPVADGDTGTNMYQTVRAAREALEESERLASPGTDLGDVLAVAGRAALDRAHGNSGTLMAVMLTAMAESFCGHARLSAPLLANALNRAETAAWAALSDPQEGTMLTVLRAVAETAARHTLGMQDMPAGQAAGRRALAGALDAVVDTAWQAVVSTEEQLAPLTEARVVDAGGMGLLLVLDALRASVLDTSLDPDLLDGLHGFAADVPHLHREMEVPEGYELMCSISLDPLAAATLRFGLNDLGDSVIMSPVDSEADPHGCVRWRLHVHVADPDAALALVQQAGEPEHLVVEPLTGAHHSEAE